MSYSAPMSHEPGLINTDTQSLPVNGVAPVTPAARDSFVKGIDRQEQRGITKYGVTLHTHNGRDSGQDALEELIDAFQYLTQARMEHTDAKTLLLRAFNTISDVIDDIDSGNLIEARARLGALIDLFFGDPQSTEDAALARAAVSLLKIS